MSNPATEPLSEKLAAQAFATALLEQWGGGVKKEAFLKKRIGSAVGRGVGSVVKRVADSGHVARMAGNQASGVGSAGLKGYAKGSLRSMAGVQPGQKAITGPVSAVARPLKAIVAPNFGTGVNSLRSGALLTYGGYKGVQGYNALGDAAEKARELSSRAKALGASNEALQDINAYSSRMGVAKGWLRGHGFLSNEGSSVRQRLLDGIMSGTADEVVFGNMADAYKSGVKGRELLNPGGAVISRALRTRIGQANATDGNKHWRDSVKSGLRDILAAGRRGDGGAVLESLKTQGEGLKSGLRAGWEKHKQRRFFS